MVTYSLHPDTRTFALVGLMQIYIVSVPILAYLPAGSHVSQGLGITIALFFGVSLLTWGHRLQLSTELVLFAIFVISAFAGGFFAADPPAFLSRQITLIQLLILGVLMLNIFTSNIAGYEMAMRAVTLGLFIAAIIATIWSSDAIGGRFAGTLLNANAFGRAMLIGVGMSLLLRMKASYGPFLQHCLALFFGVQVVFSGSRQAMLGLLILAIFYILTALMAHQGRFLKLLAQAAGILLIAFLLINWIQATPHWHRIENLVGFLQGQEVREGSVYARLDLAKAGLQTWTQSPLFGIGANQFKYHAGQYRLTQAYTHSNFIEILSGFGLVGFILYYSIYAVLTWRIVKDLQTYWAIPTFRRQLLLTMGLWISWLVVEIAAVTYYDKVHWILIGIILVQSHNLRRMQMPNMMNSH